MDDLKTSKKVRDLIKKRDKTVYFKTPIRFPADLEQQLRDAADAAGKSFNNFVVSSTCAAAGLPEPVPEKAGRKPKAKTMPKTPDDSKA